MQKKTVVLIVFALILGGLYAVYFTNWFGSPAMRIVPQIRPGRPSRLNEEVYPVTFAFDGKYRLKSVKVVEVAEAATNKYPHALWHMVTETNTAPLKWIMYGLPIKGMAPSIPKAKPQKLEAGVKYRLLIDAVENKGSVDFETKEVSGK